MASDPEFLFGLKEEELSTPPPRPKARWNIASIVLPPIGFCIGHLLLIGATYGDPNGWRFIGLIYYTAIGCTTFGLSCAVIALVRFERLWGLSL